MSKNRWNSRPKPEAPATAEAPGGTRSVNPMDAAIAAAILAITTGVGIQIALHFRQEAAQIDKQRQASIGECRNLTSALKHLDARRAAMTQLRHDVDHYVADVSSRPLVPWTTVMGELSRRRPQGVWTTQISGDGPRFRVAVTAARPDLAQRYTQSLRESAYVDYAGLPVGPVTAQTQVSGRWTGE